MFQTISVVASIMATFKLFSPRYITILILATNPEFLGKLAPNLAYSKTWNNSIIEISQEALLKNIFISLNWSHDILLKDHIL